jgi:predicted lipoprotein with Yx(FWY)xxD motif
MKLRIALVTVAVVALAAAGVAAASAVTHTSAGASGTVDLRSTKLGKVLVAKSGLTLYLFKADKSGRSVCYGQCATYWPPLLATTKPTAGTGVKATMLETIKRKDGTKQVTYAGHPLYRFKLDKKAGQVNGEGQDFFGGKWYGVNAAGKAVTHAAAGGGTTSTPTYTYPGY